MLQELYEQYKDTFSKSDHKLIQYLLRNEEQLQYLTSEELSAHTGISPENKAADPGYCHSQFPPYFCTEAF